MRILMVIAAAGAVGAAGCATKRYPIAVPLSAVESELMTCRELALEIDRIDSTRTQIANTAETDWRSVAGFLGDYGIGNAMAKSEAERALTERYRQVRRAQEARSCNGAIEPAAPAPSQDSAPGSVTPIL